MPNDEPPINRRAFFRQSLRELFKPLAKAAEPFEQVIHQLGAMDDEAAAALAHQRATQPVAATPTANPLGPVSCGRRGPCPRPSSATPAAAAASASASARPSASRSTPPGLRGNGVPFIDVDAAACVMCDGLLCMHSCPTGALVPTPLADVDMGTAHWHSHTCLRTFDAQPCTVCIDVCPVGEVAIQLIGNHVWVKADGCTGCGLCQNRCPTTPKSITVTPRQATAAPAPTPRPRPR